jgi:hypothetical protein
MAWYLVKYRKTLHLPLFSGFQLIKVKMVKLSLCLTMHHAMKTYWGSGGIAPSILDLGTRWRWVVSFTTRPLYPQEKSLCFPLDRGWVGPRAVLDAVVKRKIPSPRRESNPRTPIVQPLAHRYTDWAITAIMFLEICNKMFKIKFICIFMLHILHVLYDEVLEC